MPSTIPIADAIAAGLACFSDAWHNFFVMLLILVSGEIAQNT